MATKRLLAFVGLSAIVGVALSACAGSSNPSGDNGSSGGGSSGGGSSGGSSGGGGGNGSGSGSGSSGSNGSSGSGSGSTSSGSTGDDGGGGSCTVMTTGGLPLTGSKGNYLQGAGGMGMTYSGYAFVFEDSHTETCGVGADAKACGTSMGCIDTGFFCGAGTTGIKNGGVTYGAGIGADLGQMMGTAEGGTATNMPYTVTGADLVFGLAFTNTDWTATTGHNGMEISINTGAGGSYCAVLATPTMGMNTVPWSMFVQKCTSPSAPGSTFGGMGQGILSVIFRANAGLASLPYDFCITSLTI